ncbi:hypothetical protein EVAR_37558_1 [Eumeta japonica]|uniref:Uncharacterized protein n=1 Tax=Eumeta variegata TaxID=151549 RepID=A0A4C1XQ82_EUMVA|nr:hypothetical protein EVAR_37558_1 [Eumeta japonica]
MFLYIQYLQNYVSQTLTTRVGQVPYVMRGRAGGHAKLDFNISSPVRGNFVLAASLHYLKVIETPPCTMLRATSIAMSGRPPPAARRAPPYRIIRTTFWAQTMRVLNYACLFKYCLQI